MVFHEDIFNTLLRYRRENPEFNFIARQRNRKGRLEAGYFFQGTDAYAFVGLINRSGGANRTRSVGIVFIPQEHSIKCHLEIVHIGEKNQDLLSFYQSLRELFPDGEYLEKGEKFIYPIGSIDKKDQKDLINFLDEYYPKIQDICISSPLKDLIISDEKFDRIIRNINEIKAEVNYWIFQGNPNFYDITGALRNGHIKSWKVTAHKNKIKQGDKVILWQTGENAGCYALAKVTSLVEIFAEEPEELQYYSSSEDAGDVERVKIEIVKNFVEDPILWSDIKDRNEFKSFKAGNQGTNFSATENEYKALLALTFKYQEMNGEKTFRAIIQSHNETDVRNYFEYLDSIIKYFDINHEDSRVVTTTVGNRLNLTIGQRYCWNLYPIGSKEGKFRLITTEKIISRSKRFKGGEIVPYQTAFDDFSIAVENKETAFKAMDSELERTSKSSYTAHNNEAFRKATFDINYRYYIIESSSFNTNSSTEMPESKIEFPLNQILYGPPGTGKTFQLQNTYFDKFTVRESSLTRKQYLENLIADKTWWQVLSMAVLDLGNVTVNEILEHELIKTKIALSNSKLPRTTIWGRLQAHTVEECENVNVSERSEPRMFFKDDDTKWSIDKSLLEQYYPEAITNLEESKNFHPSPDKLIKNYEFVTFHQSFSYEDFVEGIKPTMEEQDTDVSYEISDGVFKKIAQKAKADPDNNYAIFIDEINRGNVSAIFGELITLLEEDKRSDGENPLSVKLPYSKREFEVPSNLYVYGTMNTADRSVEALDTALRRRFSFKEVMPNPNLLNPIEFEGFNLEEVLETINERIEFLLDRDHTIGHSYFMKVESYDTEALEQVFKNKVIPLLQEYFYHDYEKIALILGPGFVKEHANQSINFPSFEGITPPDNVTSYELIEDFEDIEDAVQKLLNKDA